MNNSDVRQIEHCVKNLQSSIEVLVEKAPSKSELKSRLKELEKNEEQNMADIHALRSANLQLAARLKSMYKKGKLPWLDTIRSHSSVQKSELELVRQPESEDEAENDNTNSKKRKAATQEVNCSESKDSEGQGQKQVPPALPLVHNKLLLDRVFTHSSTVDAGASKLERISSSNERLEFLGDSYLNTAVTSILFEKFPQSDEGFLTQMRSTFVRNSQLVGWSQMYNLDKKLIIANESVQTQQSSEVPKYVADVFEAYIGALIVENGHGKGIDLVYEWLKSLIERELNKKSYMQQYQSKVAKTDSLSTDYINQLYSLIGSAKNKPEYVTVQHGDHTTPFKVKIVMCGEEIGAGTGKTIKESRRAAAMDAMVNHKELVEKYHVIRKELEKDETTVNVEFDSFEATLKEKLEKETGKKVLVVPCDTTGTKSDAEVAKTFVFTHGKKLVDYNESQDEDGNHIIGMDVSDDVLIRCVAKDADMGKNSIGKWILSRKKYIKRLYK